MCNRTLVCLLSLISLSFSVSGIITSYVPENRNLDSFTVAQQQRNIPPVSERGSGRRSSPETALKK